MRVRVLLLLLALVGVSACGAQSSGLPESTAVMPDDAVRVTFEPVFSAQISGIAEPGRLVIRDAQEWNAFWDDATRNLLPKPETPGVDFGRHMVIVAAMGTRGTGGYAISIDDVGEAQGRLFAVVREFSPGFGCITTQVVTAPLTAVRVPRSDEPVTFDEREERRDCG